MLDITAWRSPTFHHWLVSFDLFCFCFVFREPKRWRGGSVQGDFMGVSTAVCGKGLLSILSILEEAPVRHKIGVFSWKEGKGLECIMINDVA